MSNTPMVLRRIESGEESELSLRDLFAAFALTGIVANSSYDPFHDSATKDNSAAAYEYADAMLNARSDVH